MMQEYIDLSDRQWKLYQWEGIYPVIPFGRTTINELLVFILPLDDNNESPVFDAFHEDPMNDWGVISVDFAEFLERYLDTKGQLNCISSSDTGNKQHQLAQSGWKMSAEDSRDGQAIVDKITACLKFNPEDSWNLKQRGRAYFSLNDYDNALNDLNQSLHLYPDQAYAYYLRGACYMIMKKYSYALRDSSIAVDMEPHDLYYITQRASAWCKLGDYKRAIEETSKVIDIDNEFELAYMTRYEAYLAIGEDEKADDDANIINGLQ
jgi:tetratricopeptide (TPR) repeat protein